MSKVAEEYPTAGWLPAPDSELQSSGVADAPAPLVPSQNAVHERRPREDAGDGRDPDGMQHDADPRIAELHVKRPAHDKCQRDDQERKKDLFESVQDRCTSAAVEKCRAHSAGVTCSPLERGSREDEERQPTL